MTPPSRPQERPPSELKLKLTGEVAKPWRAEVNAGDDVWNTNALRFETRDDALEYARDLAHRWLLVTHWRAVDESVPLTQSYAEGSEDGHW